MKGSTLFASFFGLLTRLVLALATVLLVLSLLAVAAVTMFFLLLWSLLRGKRPVIDLSAFNRARQFRAGRPMQARSSRPSAKPAGEVIDAEVREVPNKERPL